LRATTDPSVPLWPNSAVAKEVPNSGGRPLSGASTPADMRKLLEEAMEKSPKDFGGFAKDQEMDMVAFQTLIKIIAPSMGDEETKALFMSMDASNDGRIQSSEIFSDLTLSILLNRINTVVNHPLKGSYHCLPRPPFHSDPRQLAAIEVLIRVFDEVVAAHARPLPQAVAPPRNQAEPANIGVFASVFGGLRKTRPVPSGARARVAEAPPPAPDAPRGAYLYGGCGCGKTVLLDLFFRSLPAGFTARRLHWHEFIRDAFRSMQRHPPGDNVFAAMADMLAKQFRVLLLDELLITHISEAILVKNLFRQMWARGMTIITTSNYLPEELYAKGFNRDQFVDFIPDLTAQCPVIDMSSDKDYRNTDAHLDAKLFFFPVSEASTALLDRTFEQVVGKDVKTNVAIPIPMEKRNLIVPFVGEDVRGARVARFSFDDLCIGNLGRADYSVIAENFHTLFITGVPRFKPDLGAEFRRFVSLTDIIYGKKVALYLQSEVHTNDLFADALLSADGLDLDELWAFRRCSSMLSEMQNPKYHHMVWLMRNHMLQESALHL